MKPRGDLKRGQTKGCLCPFTIVITAMRPAPEGCALVKISGEHNDACKQRSAVEHIRQHSLTAREKMDEIVLSNEGLPDSELSALFRFEMAKPFMLDNNIPITKDNWRELEVRCFVVISEVIDLRTAD